MDNVMNLLGSDLLGAVESAPILGVVASSEPILLPSPVVAAVEPTTIPEAVSEPVLAIAANTAPARKVKAKAKVAKPKKRGRGRPPVFVGKLAKYIASLVRRHGATNTRKILAARKGSKLAAHRNDEMLPKPKSISMPTLLGIAKTYKVKLHRGRPKLKQAA